MSPPLTAGTAVVSTIGSFDVHNPSFSLEPLQAPAAFVDRVARILHANSPFYALLQDADLGEANWVAAFEEPQRIRALIDSVQDSHQMVMAPIDHDEGKLTIWIVASANARPMTGRQDTIRLVSLHSATDAVRLHLSLRDGHKQSGGDGACTEALQRHFECLSSVTPPRGNDAAHANPTRVIVNALLSRTRRRNSSGGKDAP